MSSAAMKLDYNFSEPVVNFTANLEDDSSFSASLTELKSATTPGLGDVWVVVATERKNDAPRTFTIIFSKTIEEETDGKITDDDDQVSVTYNNYENLDNPTLQKARSGTIEYKLDASTKSFTGSFKANIEKHDGSGTYLCDGFFDTVLS